MSIAVVHVIPSLARGGGSLGTLAAIKQVASADPDIDAKVVSLAAADPRMLEEAAAREVPIIEAPSPRRLAAELTGADIVQLSYWNHSALYDLLRGGLPPCRLVIWFLAGGSAPHAASPELVGFADRAVSASPVEDGGALIPELPCLTDHARVAAVEPRAHEGFVAGYIGTVDPVKMHPDFVRMCVAVERPDARFVVCGGGGGFPALAAEAERLGARESFDLRGWVDDVGAELAGFDVFGYPLRRDNYSTAELVLQEAMMAGVPPVVLPHGGAGALVEDGRTGIVAADERDYSRAIDRLAADPELRRRLGSAAREHALESFSAPAVARRWIELYGALLEEPKRERPWPGPPVRTGAELFVASLWGHGAAFEASMRSADAEEALAADEAVAAASPPLVSGDGGVLDYRSRFPDDPWLRLWSGLVLDAMGRPAFAAGELAAARGLGIDPARVEPRLAALTGAAA